MEQLDSKEYYKKLNQPFIYFLLSIFKLHDIIEASCIGLKQAKETPRIMEYLHKIENSTLDIEELTKEPKRIADVACEEIDAGFPFLYSQSLLMMYANLENTVKTLIIEYFRNNKMTDFDDGKGKKINLIVQNTEDVDVIEYTFKEYENKIIKNRTLGYGIERFEALLQPIGFSGDVDLVLVKDIHELNQIRNTIVHRASIADAHFIAKCPDLGYKIGDMIAIDCVDYEKYYCAIGNYVLEITRRLGKEMGCDITKLNEAKMKFPKTYFKAYAVPKDIS
ncbi:hypothetical protein EKL97_15400 [Flavobacterium sp. LS1P28]|uniref:hypothetical protein n=1 Tax=Flavobacterium sp. LS1P28 TaxID=2497752 RepID=UPI000F84231A|nr:hypothetical protein [Flavobacterium sp. LS1P28]RTY77469.1 hypothetical protein EKL97_15400 [Flavobacterium sp. LS1P28]